MQKQKQWFTLVELIVVIVILGILSTIGFVSYNGYLWGARDSNRITQLKNINDALNLYSSRNTLPLPDNYITVYTAANNPIMFQGKAGANVLELINYTSWGQDPKDDSYYTYTLTNDRKRVQLLWFLEEADNLQTYLPGITQTHAADYTNRFPKTYGKKLGTLVQTTTNTPVEDIAAFTTSGEMYLDAVTSPSSYDALFGDGSTEKLSGVGTVLQAMAPNGSCKRIREVGNSTWDGVYEINITGVADAEFEVYCDMTNGWGGWTMIGSNVTSGSLTKWVFGTILVNPGDDKAVQISQTDFRGRLTEAMACSSENCWFWPMTTAFKSSLNSTATITENNTLKRISGTTWQTSILATSSLYNVSDWSTIFFQVNQWTTAWVWSPGVNRFPMSGIWAINTWGAGDKWELYVR